MQKLKVAFFDTKGGDSVLSDVRQETQIVLEPSSDGEEMRILQIGGFL
jgi:bifunctional DNA-binding transcriptional regulator/antitoxin component of YhaV-PrlF toxin-antitoxin module